MLHQILAQTFYEDAQAGLRLCCSRRQVSRVKAHMSYCFKLYSEKQLKDT